MNPARSTRTFLCISAALFALSATSFAQLDRALEAHGGVAKWKSYGSVEFDLSWDSPKGTKKDHQLFNLRSREGLITGENYSLGASNGEVWIKPDPTALGGTPPRFYMWTPFYFFGMPFVFADPGAIQESLGTKSFQGREYDATRITFKKGTGDSSDDFYVAYVDRLSGQLKLVSYVVTYPMMRKGKPIEELEQHAIVFQDWQEADGLKVPKSAPFYVWKNENIEGDAIATLEFSNVHFSEKAPDASKFAMPEDAVIAPME
ncbi:MAG: hypothetical protein H0W66_06620 [Chthoniobacterales bacterium]|nr:hypothetical protein [Chthoniobacterales bacterium]